MDEFNNDNVFDEFDDSGENKKTENENVVSDENDFKSAHSEINEKNAKAEKTDKKATKPAKNGDKKGFFARYGKKIAAYALCFIAGAGVFWSGWLTHYFSQNDRIKSLNFFLNNYDEYYFETRDGEGDKNVTKILADAILDKYSEFYTAEEYAQETKSSRGEKKGLGLTFLSDKFSIYSVGGNSPAEKAGVKAGGEVTGYKFSESEAYTETGDDKRSALNDFIEKANKQQGGVIYLKIKYENAENAVEYRLEKAEYNESYVYYADRSGYFGYSGEKELAFYKMGEPADFGFALGEKTGYIKLTQFNGLSGGTLGGAGQFAGALEKFKQNGKTCLILDLRGNGGGFMSILCDIASYLCNFDGNSALCQKAIDKNGNSQLFNMPASKYKNYNFEKIAVLADEGSASASEALIGAMLDYDKKSGSNALSVILSPSQNEKGETVYKSYGKGIMQSTFINPLSGEAVKLTTAKIQWPISGICIHGTGVTPALNENGYKVFCAGGSGVADGISAADEYFSAKNSVKNETSI